MHRKLVLALAACASASVVQAGEPRADITRGTAGYTYFNQTGATMADHDSAVTACTEIATREMVQPTDMKLVLATGVLSGLTGGVAGAAIEGFGGGLQGVQAQKGVQANIENCMVARGWRVVRLDATEGAGLKALSKPDLHARLAEWVGVEKPHGEVVRVFADEAANAKTIMFGLAGAKNEPSLSLAAVEIDDKGFKPGPKLPRKPRTAKSPEPLTIEQIAKPHPDAALVVVRMRAAPVQAGETIGFLRAGPDPDTPAWVADKLPDSFAATFQPRDQDVDSEAAREVSYTFAVPPGRWRVGWRGRNGFDVSFCMGAPAFEVKAGDVVYAGEFDLTSDLGPDMSMAKAKAPFTGPIAAVGAKMQPAAYQNGDTGRCGGAYAYALTVKAADVLNAASAPAAPTPAAPAPAPAAAGRPASAPQP